MNSAFNAINEIYDQLLIAVEFHAPENVREVLKPFIERLIKKELASSTSPSPATKLEVVCHPNDRVHTKN